MQREKDFILFQKSITEYSYKGFFFIFFIYFGSILFASILCPYIYKIIQFWNQHSPNELNSYLIQKGLDVYFDRLRWIPLLLGLPFLMKMCNLLSFRQLGFSLEKFKKRFFLSTFIGILLVFALAIGQYFSSHVQIKEIFSFSNFLKIIISSFLSGLILGILEETVFRGFLLKLFYTAFNPRIAIIVSSLFFAYTHFKIPDDIFMHSIQDIHWYSGFIIGFWTIFGIFHSFNLYLFLNLFLLGCVLSVLTLKNKSLVPPIGFHLGIVWSIFCYKRLFNIDSYNLFFGQSGGFTEAPFVTILLLITLYFISSTNKEKSL